MPSKYIEVYSENELDQIAMAELLNKSITLPKWVKEAILLEMRPLFLRTRNLDTAQKNQLLEDIVKTMFPNIDVVHLKIHAKDCCRSFYDWRNSLWTSIKTKYENSIHSATNTNTNTNNNTNTIDKLGNSLKNWHIHEIFRPWLQHIPGTISQEVEQNLRDVILFGFWCLRNFPTTSHDKFFAANTDLYTINVNFKSVNGYNIATSLDLSKYEISATRSYKNSKETEGESSIKKYKNK